MHHSFVNNPSKTHRILFTKEKISLPHFLVFKRETFACFAPQYMFWIIILLSAIPIPLQNLEDSESVSLSEVIAEMSFTIPEAVANRKASRINYYRNVEILINPLLAHNLVYWPAKRKFLIKEKTLFSKLALFYISFKGESNKRKPKRIIVLLV